jgi:hypothetical protein
MNLQYITFDYKQFNILNFNDQLALLINDIITLVYFNCMTCLLMQNLLK